MAHKKSTTEGAIPAKENFKILSEMDPLPALKWDDTLARAAQYHVLDTGKYPAVVGHKSRNG